MIYLVYSFFFLKIFKDVLMFIEIVRIKFYGKRTRNIIQARND